MTKSKTTQQKTATSTASSKPSNGTDPLAGYQDADEQLQPDGYWVPEAGPLHGVLMTAWQYKQKSGRSKGQLRTIYVFRVLSDTPASIGEGGAREFETLTRGKLCAVFDSAGLSALRELSGCAVFLKRKPEKKVLSNGNEMWLYDVKFKGQKKKLEVREALGRSADDAPDVPDDDNYADAF